MLPHSSLLPTSKNDAACVREYRDADREAFERFNRAWVETYFSIEPIDAAIFSDPRKMILDDGGRIFIAEVGGVAAGACALKAADVDTYELSKMGVDAQYKGRGIAKKLTEHCIRTSRGLGKKRIIIFSNRILENAIRIYQACGFTEIPLTQEDKKYYRRVNIKLELML